MANITIPAITDENILRNVTFTGHGVRLLLWDTHRTQGHKSVLGYAFYTDRPEPLFVGEFSCPQSVAIDSNSTILSRLSFLTSRLGDTDEEYFDGYSEAQLEWRDSSACEQLGCDRSLADDNHYLQSEFIIDL
jgi:hypothetical protein